MNNAVWAEGSRMSGDANIAAEVCARLEAEGNLSASALVEASRADDAPLHDMFEWNDTIAAEKYREVQARKIIRSIVITTTDKPIATRAFHSTGPKTYESIEHVMTDENKRRYLLNAALSELGNFKRRYQTLVELAGIFKAIDDIGVK